MRKQIKQTNIIIFQKDDIAILEVWELGVVVDREKLFKSFFNFLFIYFWCGHCTGSPLLRVGFLYLQQGGLLLSCGAQTYCNSFSCCRALALEHRLSSSGMWTSLLQGMWAPPRPKITMDPTCVPCIDRQILNHWTTREVLK